MAAIDERSAQPPPAALRCSYHPEVETLLRCSRCGKPICPRCGVRTPVGLRCPDCAGVAARIPLDPTALARGAVAGALVAVPVGLLWGLAPAWGFYLALLLGFAGAEAIAKALPGRRGRALQFLAVAVILVGLFLSRWLLARQAGIDLGDVNRFSPRLERALLLRPVPDLLFMAIPLVIAWVRFR